MVQNEYHALGEAYDDVEKRKNGDVSWKALTAHMQRADADRNEETIIPTSLKECRRCRSVMPLSTLRMPRFSAERCCGLALIPLSISPRSRSPRPLIRCQALGTQR